MNSEDDKMKLKYWIEFYPFEEFKQKNKHLFNKPPPSFSILASRLVEKLVGWKPTTLVWLEGRYRPMPKDGTIRLQILPTVH